MTTMFIHHNNSIRRASGLLVVAASYFSCMEPLCAAHETLRESFDSGEVNRELWSESAGGGATRKFEDGLIWYQMPAGGAEGRGPAGLKSRFQLRGDFNIRCDYRIRSMPQPEKEWINLELKVEGADGGAAMIRTNHSTEGNGYSLWFGPPPETKREGAWKHEKTSDKRGTLRISRTGKTVYFESLDESGAATPLGDVEVGTSDVDTVYIQLTAPQTDFPVEAALGNVVIQADEIVRPPAAAASLTGEWGAARISLFVSVLAAVAAIVVVYVRRRRSG